MSRLILLFGSGSDQENVGDLAMMRRRLVRLQSIFTDHSIILWCESLDAVENLVGVDARRFPNVLGTAHKPKTKAPGKGFLSRAYGRISLIARTADLLVGSAVSKVIHRPVGVFHATRAVVRTLREVDIVITYGSGALNDLWLRQNVLRWSLVYMSAHILGKPVAVTGQGIGPLRSRLGRFVLARALNSTSLITVRDAGGSLELLRELKVTRPVIAFTGDDALEQPALPGSRLQDIFQGEGIPYARPGIVVHVRPTDYQNGLTGVFPMIAAALDELVETQDSHVVFVPMSSKQTIDDRDAGNQVRAQMIHRERAKVLSGDYAPAELKAIIGRHALAIGVSYHFALFALSSGVPTVTLYSNDYYRQKGLGLAASFGAGTTPVSLKESSAQNIVSAGTRLLLDREELRRSLLIRTDAMVERIQEADRYLRELMTTSGRPGRAESGQLLAGTEWNVGNRS